MADVRTHRIRLRLPGGAESEAEGSPEFVHQERIEFIGSLQPGNPDSTPLPGTNSPYAYGPPNIDWDAITELKGHNLQLRAKLPGDKSQKDACLVLMAASHKLLSQPKPTATALAKWLRGSGYPISRMDRALQDSISQGEILSSGSRRGRRYELTAPGRLRAFILANQLTERITGRA